jgi:hypothetical protein
MSIRGKLIDQLFLGKDPMKNIFVTHDTGAPSSSLTAYPFVYNAHDDDWYIFSQTTSDFVKVVG